MQLEISEETYSRLDKLRTKRFERRPGEVPLGRFLEDLISDYLDKLELSQKYEPILEEYLVEADRVFVKDNLNKQIVELNFREGKLFCLLDQDYKCVHVGFSWSDPRVVALIAQRELRNSEAKK